MRASSQCCGGHGGDTGGGVHRDRGNLGDLGLDRNAKQGFRRACGILHHLRQPVAHLGVCGAHGAFDPHGIGQDVARRAALHQTKGHHARSACIHHAGGGLLDGGDQVGAGGNGVFAGVRHRPVRTIGADRDVDVVRRGQGCRRRDADHALGQFGRIVQGVDLVAGEAVEQPVCDHRPRPGQQFLGRLENEPHGAVEITGLRKVGGRRQRRHHVPVMAAAMKPRRVGGGIVDLRRFRHRQRVEFGAKGDAPPRLAVALQGAKDAGAADPGCHRIAKIAQEIGHEAGGARHLEPGFGMTVQVAQPSVGGFAVGVIPSGEHATRAPFCLASRPLSPNT